MQFALGLFLTFLMGISLGMLGGGGSILAVPILRYVLGQEPKTAIAFSLVLVGSTALAGAALQYRVRQVDVRGALLFAAFGAPCSYAGARLSKLVAGELLMFLFGLLMLAAAVAMLRGRKGLEKAEARTNFAMFALVGAAIGMLTGFLGVGGGFLIVPALVLLAGMPMKRAVGTSLLVIALNSAVGVVGHRSELVMSAGLTLALAAAALAGTFLGVRVAGMLDAQGLRRIFALFILVVGGLMVWQNLPLR